MKGICFQTWLSWVSILNFTLGVPFGDDLLFSSLNVAKKPEQQPSPAWDFDPFHPSPTSACKLCASDSWTHTHNGRWPLRRCNNRFTAGIHILGKAPTATVAKDFLTNPIVWGFLAEGFWLCEISRCISFLMRLAFTGENGHHRSKKKVVKCQWISFFRWTHFLEPEHGFAKKSEWLRLDLRLFGGWKKTTNIPPNGGLTVIYDGRK